MVSSGAGSQRKVERSAVEVYFGYVLKGGYLTSENGVAAAKWRPFLFQQFRKYLMHQQEGGLVK